jgi:pimeloyl-ACP methyl ester carboxylesterase
MRRLHLLAGAMLLLVALTTPQVRAAEDAPNHEPVEEVADSSIPVGKRGILPLYVSADWSSPLPAITRAVVVVHGLGRNASGYFRNARKARAEAGEAGKGAIVIAPHFLAGVDIDAFRLPRDTLRWTFTSWEGGEPAVGPAPVSSFEALDAILEKLADRSLFPNLKQVVLVGHSGGGQMVQRYAIAARGDAGLVKEGVAVRYVVANPSTYVYFSRERPQPSIAASCPKFNEWKYGMEQRPAYLAGTAVAALEQAYVARRVIYLLGTMDNDPNHSELDRTCMGEAQGPTRYARGHTYAAMMKARDGGTPNHVVWDVPGVAHSGGKMLTSPCGVTALFDVPGCEAAR